MTALIPEGTRVLHALTSKTGVVTDRGAVTRVKYDGGGKSNVYVDHLIVLPAASAA